MAVVDAHAHIYPEKIATRAVNAVGDFYTIPMYGDGTSEHVREAMQRSPITHFFLLGVATTAKSVQSVNNFLAAECQAHPEFIGFMAMHQDYEDPEAEINRALELGLRGLKLHPDTQEVAIDDARLMAVYEIAAAKGIPVAIHTGDYRYDYSHPSRLKKVLHTFPDLVVNGAHLCGWSIPEIGYDLLHEERVFMDISSTMALTGLRRAEELVRLWGTSRIMFGSDFPMWDPADEYNQFTSLHFTDDELENMLWHNAERFVGMKIG